MKGDALLPQKTTYTFEVQLFVTNYSVMCDPIPHDAITSLVFDSGPCDVSDHNNSQSLSTSECERFISVDNTDYM